MAVYLNGELVTPTRFPDRTQQVWKLGPQPLGVPFVIRWDYEDDGELITVAQLKCLLTDHRVILNVPYLPYARQDKRVSNDATFGLVPFAQLINSLNFVEVRCFDAHNSTIAQGLIQRLSDESACKLIAHVFNERSYDAVVFPDGGAMNRYQYSADWNFMGRGAKQRDAATGAIVGFSMQWSEDGGGTFSATKPPPHEVRRFLIADDICDGGATFEHCAKAIRAAAHIKPTIGLYVSHGLFTRGFTHLQEAGISEFYTRKGRVTPPDANARIKT